MSSRFRRLAFGVFAVLAEVAFASGRARAAEPQRPLREAITVEAGATCLDAETLIEHVQSWIGAERVESDVIVDVRGSPDQPRVVDFRTLRAGQVIAVRRFDPGPARCEQLHAVLGLAIAMALNASLIDDIAPTAIRPPAPVPPASLPVPLAEPRWGVAAEVLGALAVLPDPAFGLDARIERVLTPTFRVRLGVLAVLGLGETFTGAPGHFDEWLVAPRLDLCAGLEVTRRIRAQGCMGTAGGGLHAQGYGYPSPRSTFIRWLAVANELGVTAAISPRWSIVADVTLILPVARNSIVLRDYAGNVIEQRDLAAVGWILGVGPMFRF